MEAGHLSEGALHVYTCGGEKKLKANVSSITTLFFWKKSFSEPGAHRFGYTGCPPTPRELPVPLLQTLSCGNTPSCLIPDEESRS